MGSNVGLGACHVTFGRGKAHLIDRAQLSRTRDFSRKVEHKREKNGECENFNLNWKKKEKF